MVRRSRLDLRQQTEFPGEENRGAALPPFLLTPGSTVLCLVCYGPAGMGMLGKEGILSFFTALDGGWIKSHKSPH